MAFKEVCSESTNLLKVITPATVCDEKAPSLRPSPFRSLENKDLCNSESIHPKTMVCSATESSEDSGKLAVDLSKASDASEIVMPNPAFRDGADENGQLSARSTPKMVRSTKTHRGIGFASPDAKASVPNGAVQANGKKTWIKSDSFADHYVVEEQIGRGKFAVVKRCQHKVTGVKYAAKFLRKRRKGKDCRNDVLKEIKMLDLAVTHPRLVDMVEVFETTHDLIIVTEYAEGGELFQKVMEEESFEEQEVKRLLRQILDAVLFLHDRNIVHLDIKPQNVLLTSASKGNIKLCDLGFARHINSGEDVRDILGTPDYVAPEILSYEPIHTSSDMWSIGVLTYVMLTGCSPFAGENNQETFLNISQGNLDFPEDIFGNISEEAVDFISKLLIVEPEDRMTARDSLQHPWLHHTPADSPIGQRRALTTPSPDTLAEEPAKKCRCQASTPPPTTANLTVFKRQTSVENVESPAEVTRTLNFDGVASKSASQESPVEGDCGKLVDCSFESGANVSSSSSCTEICSSSCSSLSSMSAEVCTENLTEIVLKLDGISGESLT